jgi:hypothetical protein
VLIITHSWAVPGADAIQTADLGSDQWSLGDPSLGVGSYASDRSAAAMTGREGRPLPRHRIE